MKRILFALSMMMISGFILATHALAGGIEQRQAQQHHRIQNGISSGALTHHEAVRLLQEQRQIQKYKVSAWRDGRLSRAEIRHLIYRLDRADRHIYQLKHNDYRRPLHRVHSGFSQHRYSHYDGSSQVPRINPSRDNRRGNARRF